MKLVEFLQGKWLGHPLHPAVVHLSLALWLGACGFDVALALGWGGSTLARLSFYCVLLGLLGTVIIVPSGVADWSSIKKEKPAWKIGLYHLLLNVAAILTWAINFGLRARTLNDPEPVTRPVLLLSILGALLLLASGYLGTLLTFDHGISVARLSKKKWREIATRGGANLPEEK